jgi:hypothetical protein
MSSQSVAGTANTIDATLNAILRCLDAIKLKMELLQPSARSSGHTQGHRSRPSCTKA